MASLKGMLSSRLVVSIMLLGLSYGVIWSLFFGVRIATTMEENEQGYMRALRSAKLCENATIFEVMHTECELAQSRVSKSLQREAVLKTWEASTLCGGSTCFVLIFGPTQTFNNIILSIVGLSIVVSLMIYSAWMLAHLISRKLGPTALTTKMVAGTRHPRFRVADIPTYQKKRTVDDTLIGHQRVPFSAPHQ